MRRLARVGIGMAGLGLVGICYVGVFGSVIVHDETGAVASAVVTDDHREQALWRLPGGLFFAVPGMEGEVEIRCRNGARARHGDVTSFMHTAVRVTGPVACGRVIDA
jgi:hypothetical protein